MWVLNENGKYLKINSTIKIFPFKALCDTAALGPYQNDVLKEKKLYDGSSKFACHKNLCYRFCDHKYGDELTDLNNCDLTWDKKKLNDCRKENKL